MYFFLKKEIKNASHEMNNNKGVSDLKKLLLFIVLLRICFEKKY